MMGMYNEVTCRCETEGCGGFGYMQVPQIVLGFGNFCIDSPEKLAEELNDEQLEQLHEYVMARDFRCETCDRSFNRLRADELPARAAKAKQLFG